MCHFLKKSPPDCFISLALAGNSESGKLHSFKEELMKNHIEFKQCLTLSCLLVCSPALLAQSQFPCPLLCPSICLSATIFPSFLLKDVLSRLLIKVNNMEWTRRDCITEIAWGSFFLHELFTSLPFVSSVHRNVWILRLCMHACLFMNICAFFCFSHLFLQLCFHREKSALISVLY